MKRLLDHDPLRGITRYHHYDPLTKKTTIETVQDVSGILDFNHERRKDESYSKRGIKEEMWHAARIPVIIQYKWLADYGIDVWNKDHQDKVDKMLDDPEWRYLKTTTGKIGKRIQWE